MSDISFAGMIAELAAYALLASAAVLAVIGLAVAALVAARRERASFRRLALGAVVSTVPAIGLALLLLLVHDGSGGGAREAADSIAFFGTIPALVAALASLALWIWFFGLRRSTARAR